jgi:hypothetical protein
MFCFKINRLFYLIKILGEDILVLIYIYYGPGTGKGNRIAW